MRPVLIHHVHLTPLAEHKRGQVSAFTAKACSNQKPNTGFFFLLLSKVVGGGRRGWVGGRGDPRVGGGGGLSRVMVVVQAGVGG